MAKSKIESVPIASVVEDLALYPRHAIDDSHVQSLVQALESGAELPPPVIDEKSRRISDGWHRMRAWKRFSGPDAVIDMEVVSYPSEAALLLDAVQRNSAHGRKLDRMDQTRCVLMLQDHGIKPVTIAAALHVTSERITKLTVKVANVRRGTKDAVPGTSKIALKRPFQHLQDTTLSASQVEAHAMGPGTSFLLIARQMTAALREKLVNLEDDKLVSALHELAAMLEQCLPVRA